MIENWKSKRENIQIIDMSMEKLYFKKYFYSVPMAWTKAAWDIGQPITSGQACDTNMVLLRKLVGHVILKWSLPEWAKCSGLPEDNTMAAF